MTKLKIIRLERQYTQDLLASVCDVSKRTIQGYEQSAKKIDNASVTTIVRLCKALACKPQDILEEKENIEFFERRK